MQVGKRQIIQLITVLTFLCEGLRLNTYGVQIYGSVSCFV